MKETDSSVSFFVEFFVHNTQFFKSKMPFFWKPTILTDTAVLLYNENAEGIIAVRNASDPKAKKRR